MSATNYDLGKFCPACDSYHVECDGRVHRCLSCDHVFTHRDPATGKRYPMPESAPLSTKKEK